MANIAALLAADGRRWCGRHGYPAVAVKAQVQQVYGSPVIAILPQLDELMTLASGGILALRYPDSPVTTLYRQAAAMLME
jgi:hypothetical protein